LSVLLNLAAKLSIFHPIVVFLLTNNVVHFTSIGKIDNSFFLLGHRFSSKMPTFAPMKQQEEITLQSLTDNEDIQIGYSDNDIVIIDSIQKWAEISAATMSMNAIAICSQGKIQVTINAQTIELHRNQVAIVPQNVVITDPMMSPDFDLKAMFFTNRILQSFLREKMNVWNDVVYIRKMHVFTMEDDELSFYTHLYDMLCLCFDKGLRGTEEADADRRDSGNHRCTFSQQPFPAVPRPAARHRREAPTSRMVCRRTLYLAQIPVGTLQETLGQDGQRVDYRTCG